CSGTTTVRIRWSPAGPTTPACSTAAPASATTSSSRSIDGSPLPSSGAPREPREPGSRIDGGGLTVMQAGSIDDVLRILDGIIADCRSRSDPLGYFPALYRAVTVRVKQGIANGAFDDGPRMAAFDAAFANRYFAAYDEFRA